MAELENINYEFFRADLIQSCNRNKVIEDQPSGLWNKYFLL